MEVSGRDAVLDAASKHKEAVTMVMFQQGSTIVSTSFGDTSVTIAPYTTMSFDLDITCTSWNTSFIAILHEAANRDKMNTP